MPGIDWGSVYNANSAPAAGAPKTATAVATPPAPSTSPAPSAKGGIDWGSVFKPAGPPTTKGGVDVSGHAFNPLNPDGQANLDKITQGVKQGMAGNFLPSLADTSGFNAVKDTITGKGQSMGTQAGTVGGKKVSTPIEENTAFNFIPELPGALANTLTSPITRIAAQIKQTFGGTGTVNLDKAGLAPVQSYSTQVSKDVNSGTPTWLAVMKQVPSIIFDTLFVSGEARRAFEPREVTLATGNKTAAIPSEVIGDSAKPSYIPISQENPAGAVVHDALSSNPRYSPEDPTYLKITPTEQGFKGQMVQIKPSLVKTAISALFDDTGRPTESIPGRAEVVVDQGGKVSSQELAQLHQGQASVIPAQPAPFEGAVTAAAPSIRAQLGLPAGAGVSAPGPQAVPAQAPSIRQQLTAANPPAETPQPAQPSNFTKGDTITVTNSQGTPQTVQFVKTAPNGIIAVEPTSGVPMLYKSSNFTFTPASSVPAVSAPQAQAPSVKQQLIQQAQTANYIPQKIKPDWVKSDNLAPGIIEQMKNAEPVSRIFQGYGSDLQVSGIKSTFPDWIPEDLRRSDIIKPVAKHLENGTLPPASAKRQVALYNYIADMIGAEELARKEGITEARTESAGKDIEDVNKLISETQAEIAAAQQELESQYNDQRSIQEAGQGQGQTERTAENQSGAGKEKNSVTLNANIIPGLDKTISEDIVPAAKGAVQRVRDIYKEIAGVVNPTGQISPQALDIIMKAKGGFEQAIFRTERAMAAIKKFWDKQPEASRLEFMQQVESGQPVAEGNQRIAELYRQRLDNMYHALDKYKDVNFLDNFFPHFWKKPEAMSQFMSRRPLEGSKSFLKKRVFATIQEGIAAGYTPVTTNPEEMMQIYEQNAQKFLMAQQIKADLKANGLFKYVQTGTKAPDGFAKIDDNIAKVYFPPEIRENYEGKEVKIYQEAGQYYAPVPVARIINNYLSKDWIQDSVTGRTLMQAKNAINSLQLGFSGFHAVAETLNATMTGLDVSMSKIARGEILGGLQALAKAPFNAIMYARDGQKFYNGDPELLKIEKDLFAGGASLRAKQYYKNQVFDNFLKNVREGNVVSALGRLPMAAIEGVMRPLFSYYIPRLKVGAFRDLFSEEIDRKSKDIEAGKISKEQVARETWNNIENRFGQINYDSLFWNRTFKSANMLLWRSVGWNLGTLRELGGSIADLEQMGEDILHGQKPDFTPKIRYALALLFLTAAIGAVYQLLHTGKRPSGIKDLFAPQNGATDVNGDPVRVLLPTYMKDVFGYSQHPIKTIKNKGAPEFALLFNLIDNSDFYNNYVYNPKDSLPIQMKQAAAYVIEQMKPFSVTNVLELQKGKATTEQQAESFLGIGKAPANFIQSDNTKAIFNASTYSQGPQTPEQQALAQLKADYRKKIQSGEKVTAEELVKAGISVDVRGANTFIANAKLTPVQRTARTLPVNVRQSLGIPTTSTGSSRSGRSGRSGRSTKR